MTQGENSVALPDNPSASSITANSTAAPAPSFESASGLSWFHQCAIANEWPPPSGTGLRLLRPPLDISCGPSPPHVQSMRAPNTVVHGWIPASVVNATATPLRMVSQRGFSVANAARAVPCAADAAVLAMLPRDQTRPFLSLHVRRTFDGECEGNPSPAVERSSRSSRARAREAGEEAGRDATRGPLRPAWNDDRLMRIPGPASYRWRLLPPSTRRHHSSSASYLRASSASDVYAAPSTSLRSRERRPRSSDTALGRSRHATPPFPSARGVVRGWSAQWGGGGTGVEAG
ncbi:hypothetical protein B0H14DRAFT_3727102 [Mycena olivaceomarginata]|nr:hypothetical protein B0H14DRAFT_3727102 [Mycena olivaceomarginata]